jgi:NH3-dependent NAD+ synthetase
LKVEKERMRRHWTRFCGGIATTRRLYATRNFSALAPKNQKHVVVGMSGGVDSSVAALLLHQQGYKVTGVYMKNWDSFDEIGEQACPHDLEYQDVQNVCKQLGIEVQHVSQTSATIELSLDTKHECRSTSYSHIGIMFSHHA